MIEIVANIWKDMEPINPPESEAIDSSATSDNHFEKIRYMISRKETSKGQLRFYRILYEAGSNGISWSQLVSKMGLTRKQMAGVLGAIGRRINKTEGLDDGQGILHILEQWEDNGEWYYRINPEFQNAIELEGILRA